MDGHSFPFPFHTRGFHQEQHRFQTSEDEQTGSSGLNNRTQIKRDRDDSIDDSGAGESSKDGGTGGGEGEMTRRPRGRPAGSKNKEKPPIIITRDSANSLRTHVIEVTDGCDIVESIATFARRRQRGLCIMSATGTVMNVSIRQPSSPSAIVNLHGRFEILSLAGSFLPPPAPPAATTLTIYLAGGQGQVVGGSVVGTLIASGPVVIMAASFSNAAYERLPLDEDDPPLPMPGGGLGSPGEVPDQQQHQQQLQQQFLADSNVGNLFHGLPPNLLNSIQMPNEGYWATGRPPY